MVNVSSKTVPGTILLSKRFAALGIVTSLSLMACSGHPGSQQDADFKESTALLSAAPPAATQAITLTEALANQDCQVKYRTGPDSDAWGLYIGPNTPCSNVTIGTVDAVFTADAPLRPVVVEHGGTLTLLDEEMTLYASSFTLWRGGIMQAGTASNPIQNQITVVMAGSESASPAAEAKGDSSIVKTTNEANNLRDITVMDGGVLSLYGGKGLSASPNGTDNDPATNPAFINTQSGTQSWTYLAAPAGPASYNDAENVSAPVSATAPETTLTLATQVDWQAGDWVSVATTSFASHQTEIVQVCGISSVANPDTPTGSISAASKASPIVITTAKPNNLATGDQVTISGVKGNTGANGSWTITRVSATEFSLNGSSGNAAYTSAGSWTEQVAEVSQLSLCQPLKHYHYGGLAPTPGFFAADTTQVVAEGGSAIDVSFQAKSFYDDHTRNYGIDERAEVALLSRNIKLTSVAGAAGEANTFTGGHISIMHGDTAPTVNLVGVEIEKFGQPFVGRYPVHLHHLHGGGSNVLVQDVSVHHSYNKCFVVHETGNARLYNNVCVRTVGQGVYLEDGTAITGNQFMRNFIAGTMAAGTTYSYPRQNGSTYWDGDNLQAMHYQTGVVTSASNASPIAITTNAPAPATGETVTITGVQGNTAANGSWTVTNTGANSFTLNGSTGNGDFSLPTWKVSGLNLITSLSGGNGSGSVIVNTQSTPVEGSQVTLSGTGIAALDTTWTVKKVIPGPPSFELVGSRSIKTSGYKQGNWTTSGNVLNASDTSPIVISSNNAVNSGAKITVSGVSGNTAANGSWTVTGINSTRFSLQGSTGNSNDQLASWEAQGATTNWYNVNGISDTSKSGANSAVGPDTSFPGGFWITNLDNTFVNNSVAGCQAQGRGYWLLSQNGQRYAYPEFTGNRVHGCYNGIDTNADTIHANNPAPTQNGGADQQSTILLLNNNTVTRVRQRGFWGRGIFITLHNNRFATNPYGFSLLGGGGPEGNLPGFWGMAHDNVIAGLTRNNVERYPGCPYSDGTWQQECTDVQLNTAYTPAPAWGNYPSINMNIQGYSYYDGPARIEHNRFVNFRYDPTGIYPDVSDRAARLLTKTDINNIKSYGQEGQLEGLVTTATNAAPSSNYKGYAGDPATGWIQSNQQTVPPTQYIKNSIWDNVDFKHQVYTEAVNMGPFNDGDKSTVILDKDSQLSGLAVVNKLGESDSDFVPVSLNNLDYYATDYTVDEPHSRGPNNFRASSLMSPHKYATLNIESVTNPFGIAVGHATRFRVRIQRDMLAYSSMDYPSLFLNGRGQNPIYEPFVMDRMGYTVYGLTGEENKKSTQAPSAFENRLLFSYTDPSVKKAGEYFINRIAVYQPVHTPGDIKVYRIRRQWGQQYAGGEWPPHYNPPGPGKSSCDGVFFENQAYKEARWQDCLARGENAAPPQAYTGAPATYSGGVQLSQAASWDAFNEAYTDFVAIAEPTNTDIQNFINSQTYYYDTSSNMLYFYMLENDPVQQLNSPYGTCGGGDTQYASKLAHIQGVKSFSNASSVKAALDASCQVASSTPQPTDLVSCGPNGCAAYIVDFTAARAATTTNSITAASNATPIAITTTATAPTTGSQVYISGVAGNTAANGLWTVTNTGANSFTLNGATGNGSFTGTTGVWSECCGPAVASTSPVQPHTISKSDYQGWNEYSFVYGTPSQQPNGLPVVANTAAGNSAPPANKTVLTGLATPTDNAAPPSGDTVTYAFLPLSGPAITVTDNFPYRCTSTTPWSPVNARGAYPPPNGFTYPLASNKCSLPSQVAGSSTNK